MQMNGPEFKVTNFTALSEREIQRVLELGLKEVKERGEDPFSFSIVPSGSMFHIYIAAR